MVSFKQSLAFALLGTGLSKNIEKPKRTFRQIVQNDPDFDDLKRYKGSCPNVYGTSDYKLSKYIKQTWWVMAISNNPWDVEDFACQSAKYKESTAHKGYIEMWNTELEYDDGEFEDEWDYIEGFAVEDTKYSPGVWSTNSFEEDEFPSGKEDNYIIIDTDNKKYAYVWSCFEDGSKYVPMMYILNTDKTLSSSKKDDQIAAAMKIMKKQFDWDKDDRNTFTENFEIMAIFLI